MAETAERVASLRDRVEAEERELEAAVHELRAAASRMTPAAWFRERPLPFVAAAFVLGWWLGGGRDRRT